MICAPAVGLPMACRGGRTGRRPRASKAGVIQRVKLPTFECCNYIIVSILSLLIHAAWI